MKRLSMLLGILCCMLCSTQMLAQDYPAPEDFVFVDQQPSPINLNDVRAAIGYPEEAVEQDVEGTVVCRILVDSTGAYVRHLIMGSAASVLQKAVETKISDLRFSPANHEGKNVAYWINVPFRFKLISQQTKLFEEKISLMTDSLTGAKDDYGLWYRRGLVYLKLEKDKEALQDFEESLLLNPQKNSKKANKNSYPYWIKATFGKATVMNREGDASGAIYNYSEVLRLAGEMKITDDEVSRLIPQVYLERGFLHMERDSLGLAKADLSLATQDTGEVKCTAFQLLADMGINEKDNEGLVTYYNGLIACYPEQNLLKYSRGYYASRSGNYEQAIKDFQFVLEEIELNQLQLATYNQLGYCYLHTKDYDKALENIDKALMLNVLNGESYYFRALVYLDQGQNEKACDNLKKSLNYASEGDYREDAIEKMKELCGGWEDE